MVIYNILKKNFSLISNGNFELLTPNLPQWLGMAIFIGRSTLAFPPLLAYVSFSSPVCEFPSLRLCCVCRFSLRISESLDQPQTRIKNNVCGCINAPQATLARVRDPLESLNMHGHGRRAFDPFLTISFFILFYSTLRIFK